MEKGRQFRLCRQGPMVFEALFSFASFPDHSKNPRQLSHGIRIDNEIDIRVILKPVFAGNRPPQVECDAGFQ
jgi:hypothetical protein